MGMILGIMVWRQHLAVLPFALLVGLLVAWGFVIHRNLLSRMSPRRAFLVLIPKAVVVLLLLIALLDPVWSRNVTVSAANKVLAVLDVSSSMDVKDAGTRSRIERARAALRELKSGLPSGMSLKTLEFDTELREPGSSQLAGKPGTVRNTDLGSVLSSLSKRSDLSSYSAVVLLTDGGDEPVENVELPGLPLSVVGVGSDLANERDLAIADVKFPAAIEKESAFEIHVDAIARNPSLFAGKAILRVPLTLEREENGLWKKDGEELVDLSRGRAQAVFKTTCHTAGLQRFRLVLKELPGELSGLNNTRILTTDVRKKSIHVLFFARELGQELKMLRGELVRDPGITFTALFRTIGERFTIQGERLPGDENLESGFPADANLLKQFDCVVIGSVSQHDWQNSQMAALKTYVENGGAVVFLGDEAAFGPNGYSASLLAPLIPWDSTATGHDMMRGEFAVSIPASAANHPILAGINELLLRSSARAAIESVLPVGALKAGATALMTVGGGNRAIPLVAVQRYGKGTILALASNTLWKWARSSDELQKAYGLFWRQAVRSLAPNVEGGQILSVKWDREFYKPGERAVAEVRTSISGNASDLVLTASLARGGEVRQIPVEPLQGQAGLFNVRLVFDQRGTYRFQLVAHQGNSMLETYEKAIPVAPLLGEGARLELDGRALAKLAKLGGGDYVDEAGMAMLVKKLTAAHLTRSVPSEVSLLSGSPWFALIFIGVLICEWLIRRRMNLF